MAGMASRAAGLKVEKVPLHPLGSAGGGNVPHGRGIRSSSDGMGPEHRRRVSTVSFRRTDGRSEGTPEIAAGKSRLFQAYRRCMTCHCIVYVQQVHQSPVGNVFHMACP